MVRRSTYTDKVAVADMVGRRALPTASERRAKLLGLPRREDTSRRTPVIEMSVFFIAKEAKSRKMEDRVIEAIKTERGKKNRGKLTTAALRVAILGRGRREVRRLASRDRQVLEAVDRLSHLGGHRTSHRGLLKLVLERELLELLEELSVIGRTRHDGRSWFFRDANKDAAK